MSWVRLDDGFVRHPRMVAAGLTGRALFVAGLCYCGAHLTDGRIPKAAVPMLAAEAGVRVGIASKLVEVGSWIDRGSEYEVHDFLVYNPSREKVLGDREASAQRQQKFRESRRDKQASNAVTNGVSSPVPTRPDPTPTEETPSESREVELADRADPVETVFAAWTESTGRTRCVLDPKRRRVIAAALKTHDLADVVDAVRGWQHSPFHRGDNDRHTVYNDLELLLRDAARIENFRDLQRNGNRIGLPVTANAKTIAAWAEATS